MRAPAFLSCSSSDRCEPACCCAPSTSYGENCTSFQEPRRAQEEDRQASQRSATSKQIVSDTPSQEDADREPCAEAASAAPSDGIMAIYQQFRHLWARSAQPAHSGHCRNRSRSYTLPSQPPPQPQQPQPPPAAPLQHFEALQQPLPILLPLFGLSAAAA
ncbi:hypothetical protein WJX75_005202 [Coccomyxa subellipsoidea]|uniref:Uncharacterized protein n=1 Tax=Coccomyxa subellipsoidea TaxID=248742 RepID=A0ABR2Z323_9CHLO